MIVQLIVASGSRTGQVIPVTVEKFIIGRAADCHLRPMSELISRYHCAILVGDEVTARDLGSRNGVRINGEKINTEQKVNNGDKLAVGPLEFFIQISDGDTQELLLGETDACWASQSSVSSGVSTDATTPTVYMN